MVFTQVPAPHTGSDALLSTTATSLPLSADRDLTPSTLSEGGSEDTANRDLMPSAISECSQYTALDKAPATRRPPKSRSSSLPSLVSIGDSEDAGAKIPGMGCTRHDLSERRSFQRRFSVNPYIIPTQASRRARTKCVLHLLLDLDSQNGVGLSLTQFRSLFSRCDDCGRIMTKRSFLTHECLDQDMDFDEELDVID